MILKENEMEEVLNMNKFMVTVLVVLFIGCGTLAFAGDSTVDCDCKKGGIGIPIGKFFIGFGAKTFNSEAVCFKSIGIGLSIGSYMNGLMFGVGYTDGVIGFGFTYKGPETTFVIGPAIGYDYGDCRLVWPYEE
jgi:hypothetical protein